MKTKLFLTVLFLLLGALLPATVDPAPTQASVAPSGTCSEWYTAGHCGAASAPGGSARLVTTRPGSSLGSPVGGTSALESSLAYGPQAAGWSALPHNGLGSRVNSLTISGSDLYAGGEFTRTADSAVSNLNHIAK